MIILNMKDEICNIYIKALIEEGYEIIEREKNIVFIKKSKTNLNENQIKRILSIVKMQNVKGISFINITSAVQYLIQKTEEEIKNDGRFSWLMRQAFVNAIVEKNKLNQKEFYNYTMMKNEINLKKEIESYNPYNEQEKNDKELMLEYMDTFKDVLTRENRMCHFTVSNWIVNKERTKVLMIYHNIYKSWAWTGGHADGDSNLLRVALKEGKEETGLENLKVLKNGIFGLQILTVDSHIKRGKFISSHLHLDCCFLLEADEEDTLKIKEDENSGVKWIEIEKVTEITNEQKMIPIYKKLNEKLKENVL